MIAGFNVEKQVTYKLIISQVLSLKAILLYRMVQCRTLRVIPETPELFKIAFMTPCLEKPVKNKTAREIDPRAVDVSVYIYD